MTLLPLISICIPTYNGAKYLADALSSAGRQTYQNIEVIISDDHSTDETLDICRDFQKSSKFPVHIYPHKPGGIGANWNHSIEKANGQWIKLLFQDDLLKPDCITVMLEVAVKNNLHAVVSGRKIIDGSSAEISSGKWFENYGNLRATAGINTSGLYRMTKKSFKSLNYASYSVNNIIGEPCVSLFSKKMFEDVGGYNNNLKQLLDYEFWLRALLKYDIGMIPEKLVAFRYHELQTSNVNNQNNIDEGHIIRNLLYSEYFWEMGRKNRSLCLRTKYPLLNSVAGLKDNLLGLFQKKF